MNRLSPLIAALLRRLRPEGGQIIVLPALCMIVFIGFAGLVIDVGQEHIAQSKLRAAANAAALAGGEFLPNIAATATACDYSASLAGDLCNNSAQAANGHNSSSTLPGVVTTTQLECLSPASAGACAIGTACPANTYFGPYGSSQQPEVAGCNAIKVTEQTTVQPWFMGVLGFGGQKITATATASAAGGIPHPLNVEMVDDTTGSMAAPDGSPDTCGGTPTGVPGSITLYQEDCAKAGIRALLATLYPCSTAFATCPAAVGDNIPTADAVDEVGLVTFPGLTGQDSNRQNVVTSSPTAPVPDELNCTKELGAGNISYGSGASYQVVPFSSDFRTSDATNPNSPLATLNPSSNLVREVYWPGDGCGSNGGYPVSGTAPPIAGGTAADTSTATNQPAPIGAGASADSVSASNGGIDVGGSTNANAAPSAIGGGPNSGSSGDSSSATTGLSGDSGSSGVFPSNSGTTLYGDAHTSLDLTTASTNGQFLPAATTVSSLQVTLSGPTSGSTATLTVEVMKNGGATGLACSLVAPSTTFTCTGGPVTFNGTTDKLNLRFSRTTGGVPDTNPTATWTLASTGGATGISISRPATAAANDFLLLTVTAEGAAVSGSSNICPTSATTGWTLVDQKRISGAGGVIQVTYSSIRPTNAAETYRFNFFATGTCAADTGNGTQTLNASAVVLRYTNVASVGLTNGTTGGPSSANLVGSATSTPWAGTSNTYSSAITSHTWSGGGGSWYTSLSANCANQTPGSCNTTPAAGTITSFTFDFGTAIGGTSSYSVALYKNGLTTGLSCNVAGGAQSCPLGGLSGLNLAVNGTDTIVLVVSRTSGAGTSYTGSATASAIDAGAGNSTHYVSLASSCVNTSATACDDATIASTGTLSSASLTFGSAVPSADTVTVTLFRNGVMTGSNCPITSATVGHTCSVIPTGIALNATDRVELQVTLAGTTAFSSTAATALVEGYSTLTAPAPALPTQQPNDQVVRLFGTGSSSFVAGSTVPGGDSLPLIVSGPSSATGADDALQPAPGPTGTESVTSTASAPWAAQTVVLIPVLPASIQIASPAGYAPGTTDVLLVTVAVQGLSGTICAPAAAPTWNPVATSTDGSGASALTETTFWTTTAAAGTSTFSFYASGCSGATAGGAASAVAAYYSGVDTTGVSPVDQSAVPGSPPAAGTTLTAPPVTTTSPDDELVSLFATDGAFSNPTPSYTNTSTTWTNSGIDNALQQPAGASSAVTAQTTASAAWTAQTIALKPLLSSSITVAPPAGYVAGDFLLVSIAVQNLGTGAICPPTDASWTPVPVAGTTTNTVTQGTLTQEAFWTTGVSTGTFTFSPSSSCTGTPINAVASAAALYYTGVDPTTPLDGVTPQPAQGITSQLQPATVRTNTANDEVVSLFASNGAFNAKPTVVYTSSSVVNSGASDVGQPTPGLYMPPPVTSTAAAAWTAETIALKPDSTMSSVAIARPPNPTTSDFVLVTVTANGLPSPDNICAPNDGSWTQVSTLTQPQAGGTLRQATFYSFRGTTTPETYQFSFRSGVCPSGGSPVSAPASAIAVRYTGVNPIIPIDQSAQVGGNNTTVAPPQVLPTYANDMLVGIYGTASTTFSSLPPGAHSVSGAASSTGFWVKSGSPPAGVPVSPSTASIPSNNWIGQTVALEAEAGGCNNCEYGLEVPTPSSFDTNYALPLTAATSALQAENVIRPADNAIILLSDGDANTAGTDPCQAGIAAAETAESPPYNDLVYVIAYGAITDSSGCTEDTSDSAPVNYDNRQGLTPQCALELMVDNHVTNPGHSDAQIAASICSNSRVTTIPGFNRFYGEANDSSLEQSFQQVGFSLTSPRLVSDDAT